MGGDDRSAKTLHQSACERGSKHEGLAAELAPDIVPLRRGTLLTSAWNSRFGVT
jgi:hypothetical protein